MPPTPRRARVHRCFQPSRRQALDRVLAATAAVAVPGLGLTLATVARAQTGMAWPQKPIQLIHP